MLRVDYEEQLLLNSDQKHSIIEVISALNPGLLIISDYIKWTIDEELVNKVLSYAHEHNTRVLVDTKPKHMHLFKGAYLIKPNFKEFLEVIGKQIPNEDEYVEHEAKLLADTYQTNIVVTRGNKWATLITKEWHVTHLHTEAQQVFDVTWAWDTFIAALAVWLAEWSSLTQAVMLGNKASGVAVGKVGTSTVSKNELT